MGAGGVIVPPEGYFEAIGAVCRKYDVLTISDEVICGFGRTGEWFGAQALDFAAERSISMAKQLTAGFLPLSAVAIDARHGRGDRGELRQDRHPRPRLHLRRPPGRLRRRRQGARDLPAHRHARPRPRARARASPPTSTGWPAHPLVGEARHLGLIGGARAGAEPLAEPASRSPARSAPAWRRS